MLTISDMRRPHFRPSKDFFCEFCGRRIRWAGDDHRYGIRLDHHAHKRCYAKAASSEAAEPLPVRPAAVAHRPQTTLLLPSVARLN